MAMFNIKCRSCGKSYKKSEGEVCPYCGSLNYLGSEHKSSSFVQSEKEHYDTAPTAQNRYDSKYGNVEKKEIKDRPMPNQKPQNTMNRQAPPPRPQQFGQNPAPKKNGCCLLTFIIIALIIGIVMCIVSLAFNLISNSFSEAEADVAAPAVTFTYEEAYVNTEFTVNNADIIVYGVYELEQSWLEGVVAPDQKMIGVRFISVKTGDSIPYNQIGEVYIGSDNIYYEPCYTYNYGDYFSNSDINLGYVSDVYRGTSWDYSLDEAIAEDLFYVIDGTIDLDSLELYVEEKVEVGNDNYKVETVYVIDLEVLEGSEV